MEFERLSVIEQTRLFESAEIKVGAHGAALNNLVSCQPETRDIELFSPKYVNLRNRGIGVAVDLKHSALILRHLL
jgi:capsular polysaccharide biosynthesis protein